MEVLFEDAKGIIYQECLKWMTSTNEHLRMSGALAMGNFARNGINKYYLLSVYQNQNWLSVYDYGYVKLLHHISVVTLIQIILNK